MKTLTDPAALRGTNVTRELESDEALYSAFRDQGDEGALDALVARHWAETFRLARAVLREPASAEDAAQQAFVQVARAAGAKKALDPFRGWLRTVAVNEARRLLRSRKRRARHEEVAAMNRPSTTPADSGAGSIAEYVATLSEELRVPLVLHYELGYSHAEVAATLGTPRSTASSRIEEGVSRIRARLTATSASFATAALDELFTSALRDEGPIPPPPSGATVLARAAKTGLLASVAGALASLARPTTLAFGVAGIAILGLLASMSPVGVAPSPEPSSPAVAVVSTEKSASAGLADQKRATTAPDASSSASLGQASPGGVNPRAAHSGTETDARATFKITVTGRLVDSKGNPVARVRVAASSIDYEHRLAKLGFGSEHEAEDQAALAAPREPSAGAARRIAFLTGYRHHLPDCSLVDLGSGESAADGSFRFELRQARTVSFEIFLGAERGDDVAFHQLPRDEDTAEEGKTVDVGSLVLRPASHLTVVARSAGLPVEGASVKLRVDGLEGAGGDSYEVTKTTGADGVVELPFLGSYLGLEVTKPGFAKETLELHQYKTPHDFEDGDRVHATFDLVADSTLAGVVRGPSGETLAGVRVELGEVKVAADGTESTTNALATLETDAQGRFEFQAVRPGGRYAVSVQADWQRHTLHTQRILVPPCRDAELVLRRGSRIVCEVTPAAGVVVPAEGEHGDPELLGLERWDAGYARWSWSSSGHAGTFENEEPGTYRVVVADRAFAPTVSREVVLAEGDDVKVSLELSRGRAVKGRLVFPGDVSPADVSKIFELNGRHESPTLAPDGTFELEHVPGVEAELEVVAIHYRRVGKLTIAAGAAVIPDVVLERAK